MAHEFGVAPETIRKILRRDTYSMVGDEGPLATPQASPEEIAASQARLLGRLGTAALQTPGGADALLAELEKSTDGGGN